MNTKNFRYNKADREAIYRVIYERRDMRHFSGGSVDKKTLWKLLDAAHHGPSVGYMQPWRFIHITDQNIRKAIHTLVEQERPKTAEALGSRSDDFMSLKLEGIMECAELLVVALADGREKYIVGRRTMPEMDLASTACAIENMWLAARAEGLGMGWVSLYNPIELANLLNMPEDSKPIGVFCIGPVDNFYNEPMLETVGWAKRENLKELVFENTWNNHATKK